MNISIKENNMDEECKKPFLVVFGISPIILLIFAWILLGGEKINNGWFYGLFDEFSVMWLPTILFLIAGWIIDKFLFEGSLLYCLKQKTRKKIFHHNIH
jgi:hypothetical protein